MGFQKTDNTFAAVTFPYLDDTLLFSACLATIAEHFADKAPNS